MDEKFCLKWNDYSANVVKSFKYLRHESEFSDVILVGDDLKQISSHKLVLSSCSTYFKEILTKNKLSNPVLCLTGVKSEDINNVLDYIYYGEVKLYQDNLDTFLDVAQRFQLEGLMNQKNIETSEDYKDLSSLTEEIEAFESNNTIIEENIIQKQQFKISNKKSHEYETTMVSSNFSNLDEVKRTIEDYVTRGPDGMWMCTKCSKVAKKKDHIQEHAETHIEGISFQCQHCDKTFRSRHSLRSHKQRCSF